MFSASVFDIQMLICFQL